VVGHMDAKNLVSRDNFCLQDTFLRQLA